MILLSASKVWLWVQRDGGIWSFPTWTRSHLSLHRHPETSLEVVEETLLILQESQFCSLLELVDAVPRWLFSGAWSPPRGFDSSICDWKNKFSFFFGKYHLFRIESFWVDFPIRPSSSNSSRSATSTSPFQFPPAYRAYPRNNPGKTFFSIDGSVTDPSRLWGILNQWTKWNNRSSKGLSKTSFVWSFPIRQ